MPDTADTAPTYTPTAGRPVAGVTWVTIRKRELDRLEHEATAARQAVQAVAEALGTPDGVAVDLHALDVVKRLGDACARIGAQEATIAGLRDDVEKAEHETAAAWREILDGLAYLANNKPTPDEVAAVAQKLRGTTSARG